MVTVTVIDETEFEFASLVTTSDGKQWRVEPNGMGIDIVDAANGTQYGHGHHPRSQHRWYEDTFAQGPYRYVGPELQATLDAIFHACGGWLLWGSNTHKEQAEREKANADYAEAHTAQPFEESPLGQAFSN